MQGHRLAASCVSFTHEQKLVCVIVETITAGALLARVAQGHTNDDDAADFNGVVTGVVAKALECDGWISDVVCTIDGDNTELEFVLTMVVILLVDAESVS